VKVLSLCKWHCSSETIGSGEMAQHQWTPYGFVPFRMQETTGGGGLSVPNSNQPAMVMMMQAQQNGGPSMFATSTTGGHQMVPAMVMMSPPPMPVNADDHMMRPHSVAAFGVPQPASAYPFFQWPTLQQQQPDVTSQQQHFGQLAQPQQPCLHHPPDVVSSSQQQDQQQPCYANQDQAVDQPTYANDSEAEQQQPSYINHGQRLARGVSLPPQLPKSGEWTPKPPPRSRRGSQRGSMTSLNGSVQSIDVAHLSNKLKQLSGSTMSLKETHPVHDGPNLPYRPPRRKDSLRRAVIGGTLPRDFKGLECIAEDLPQYDVPPVHLEESPDEQKDLDDLVKPTVPQPGSSEIGPTKQLAVAVPQPGSFSAATLPDIPVVEDQSGAVPKIPMPGAADSVHIKAELLIEAAEEPTAIIPPLPICQLLTEDETQIPTIPQPDGSIQIPEQQETRSASVFSDDSRPVSPSPTGSVSAVYKRKNKRSSALDPIRSRTTSMQSIRDEIIDGLQKMTSSVDILKKGVVKIYEDLMPAGPPMYAFPIKAADHEKHKVKKAVVAVENPYETVAFACDDDQDHGAAVLVIPETVTQIMHPPPLSEAQIRDHIDKAFRATFFGILPVEMDKNSSEEDDDYDDDGDVTPTGEEVVQPEVANQTTIKESRNEDNGVDTTGAGTEDKEENDDDDEKESEDGSTTEEIGTDTETLDISLDMDGNSTTGKDSSDLDDEPGGDRYNELMYKTIGTSWDEMDDDDDTGLPPPLVLHAKISNLKLDLLSSIFQNLYPTEEDCLLIRRFISSPASLEEKYTMIRLSDILKKNKRAGIELEDIAEAMSQLAKIGSELLRPEEERDPVWRSIPVAKEIMVTKGIASRAPWESIQAGVQTVQIQIHYSVFTNWRISYC
jgi:hypothetical protein